MLHKKLFIFLFLIGNVCIGTHVTHAENYTPNLSFKQSISSVWVRNRPSYIGKTHIEIEKKVTETKPFNSNNEASGKQILINLASRQLYLYDNNRKIKTYPVAVGTYEMQTPVGYFSIEEKEKNPIWTDPEDTKHVVKSGPENPLGMRWMRIGGNYGIHGTNAPHSVGRYVSHGCIRMRESDVEELFDNVELRTPVEIYYDRIVINRDHDHTISYFIYPDGYAKQDISVADVKKALSGYGVDAFASEQSILESIQNSNAQQIYVAKAYNIFFDKKKLDKKAIQKDGVIYIPVDTISSMFKIQLEYNAETNLLTSPYGTANCIEKSGNFYIKEKDLAVLFNKTGQLTKEYTYIIGAVN